ncbi:MAG: NAD(P)H-hydrate dehydratase [Desulfobacula sp.]|nr:NAD(P)H-hydrate dehydratase [Desulfobacula sp.]
MFLVTAGQMQEMDKQAIESFGISGLVLMENAARGAVDILINRYKDLKTKRIAILAGRGNNGGDGFVIARYLMEKGILVNTFLLSKKKKVQGDAKINMDLAQKLCDGNNAGEIIEIPDAKTFQNNRAAICRHDLIIDAILGTGLNSDVKGFFKDAIELLNRSKSPIFAIDIPSGLHSDTGQPLGIAVKADATATFAFAKAGHILYPGNKYTGKLDVVDIGITNYIAREKSISLSVLTKKQIAPLFPSRSFDSHKGSYGHLAIIAGSPGKTGAAALCANAAARSGTGLITLGIPESLNERLEPQVTEPMTRPLKEDGNGLLTETCMDQINTMLDGKQALALGPGIGTHDRTKKLVHALIEKSQIPLIIDADGLNCLADNSKVLKKKKAPAILTPHPGEMARLCRTSTAKVQADRIGTAISFAKNHDVILVLKGAQTIIALPDGTCSICPTGNPGMASGGMGDVLTGMIAGFCAQGFSPKDAARAGVYIHGLCADRLAKKLSKKMGAFGYLATDVMNDIPFAIHQDLL